VMKRQNVDIEALRTIGWKHWDPIGLAKMDLPIEDFPVDEYGAYLLQAAGMCTNGKSVSDIADFLEKIETENMGLNENKSSRARAIVTATAICETGEVNANASVPYRRPFRAFLLTPVIVAFCYSLQTAYILWFSGRGSENSIVQKGAEYLLHLVMYWSFATPLAAIVIVLFGLPVYYLLRRFQIENVVITMISAAGIAAFFYAIPDLLPRGNSSFSLYAEQCQIIVDDVRTECGWRIFWREFWINTIWGAFAGLVFWRVYAGK
jgi:hypothetical protein